MAIASDLDGDGFSDAVTGADAICAVPGCGLWLPQQPGGLQILMGSANGLQPPLLAAPSVFANRSIVAGDLDHDGDQDLVVLGYQSGLGGLGAIIRVLQNDGSGNLLPTVQLQTPVWAANLLLGDFNGDLALDIAVLGGIGSSYFVQAFLQTGPMNFLAQQAVSVSASVGPARAADINGDGTDDIVFASLGGLGVLQGSSTGPLFGESFLPLFAQSASPADFRFFDWNGDSHIDLVSAQSLLSASRLVLHLGDGAGGFHSPVFVTDPLWNGIQAITIADLDEDLDDDIILTWSNSLGQSWLSVVEMDGANPTVLPFASPIGNGADPLALKAGPRLPNLATLNQFSDTWNMLLSTTPQSVITTHASPGAAFRLIVDAPLDGGLAYVSALSLAASPGVVLPDGRIVHLAPDPLFLMTASGQLPYPGSVGTLDAFGSATMLIPIPNDPILSGLVISCAFVTLDTNSPSGVRSIGVTKALRVL
jgi:hypothetical protein